MVTTRIQDGLTLGTLILREVTEQVTFSAGNPMRLSRKIGLDGMIEKVFNRTGGSEPNGSWDSKIAAWVKEGRLCFRTESHSTISTKGLREIKEEWGISPDELPDNIRAFLFTPALALDDPILKDLISSWRLEEVYTTPDGVFLVRELDKDGRRKVEIRSDRYSIGNIFLLSPAGKITHFVPGKGEEESEEGLTPEARLFLESRGMVFKKVEVPVLDTSHLL